MIKFCFFELVLNFCQHYICKQINESHSYTQNVEKQQFTARHLPFAHFPLATTFNDFS